MVQLHFHTHNLQASRNDAGSYVSQNGWLGLYRMWNLAFLKHLHPIKQHLIGIEWRGRVFFLFSLYIAHNFIPLQTYWWYKDKAMDKPMNRIKEVLEERGIKQTWLAEKLGKSFCIVNAYVCNRRQPSLEVLFEIAKILNVDVKELIHSSEK